MKEEEERKYSKKPTGLLDGYGEMSNGCYILVPHTTFHSSFHIRTFLSSRRTKHEFSFFFLLS